MSRATDGRVERNREVLDVVGLGVPRHAGAAEVFFGGFDGDLAKSLGLVWGEGSVVRGRSVVSLRGRRFVGLQVNGV